MSFAAFALALGGGLWAYLALSAAAGSGPAAPLILHYDDLSGITAVGGIGTVSFAAVFGVLAVLVNFLVALELDARDWFLGKFTAGATLVFAILLFIGFAAIIGVNV